MTTSKIYLNDLTYDDIKVGQTFSFERFISESDVNKFAELTSDYNPLHTDEKYAKESEFGNRIVHGMLTGSFFSTLLGMLCPGKRCLYVSQTLNFKKALKMNSEIVVCGTVTHKLNSVRIIEMKTEIFDKSGNIIVDGIARAKIRKS